MEVELATSAQKRNIVLTFAAATVTVVAVIAVLAGPAMLDCAASPDGMANCLRDKVSDFGLLPPRDVEGLAEPTPPESVPPLPEVATDAPELTLLRAEPDGSMVVAGTAGAGARVAVYVNGELLGTVTAEPSGDWALVPDAPLPSGGSEITVREAEGEGVGTRSFVVVIDPDKIEEPKVVATTPAEAGDVLAELTEPEAAVETEPQPAAEPQSEPAPSAAPAAQAVAPLRPEDVFTIVAQVPPQLHFATQFVATAGTAAAASGRLWFPEPVVEVAAVDPFAIAPEIPPPLRFDAHVSGRSGTLAFVHANVEMPPPAAVVAGIDTFAITPEVPRATPADTTVPVAQPETAVVDPPTIEAIEIDGRMNFFAGAGEEGATVRLFIGDRLVGESKVEGERWLVEAPDALTLPDQRIRVEMVLEGAPAVAATASANVTVDLPELAAPIEQAPRRAITAEVPRLAVRARDLPTRPEAPAVEVGTAAVEGSAGVGIVTERVDLAVLPPQAEPLAPSAPVAPPSSPSIAILEAKPLQPSVAGAEGEASSVNALPDAAGAGIPTIRATPLRELRFASGRVIIRRGDTLWDIADRIYGDGYKYRTIYRANRDKIRRPGRIFPGQVFDIPLVYDDY